jgi:lipopolysaccharide transport system ATP-binding protein
MYVRLAFAVAAHLEPEILLVDEVLAVGDMAFRKKCLGKMGEVARCGRTVLFVSHNMSAVRALCTKAAYLDQGRLAHFGSVDEAVRLYEGQVISEQHSGDWPPEVLYDQGPDAEAAEGARIVRVETLDQHGRAKPIVASGDTVRFRLWYESDRRVVGASAVLSVATMHGQNLLLCSTSPDSAVEMDLQPGRHYVDCQFEQFPLAAGRFSVGAGLAVPDVEWLYRRDNLAALTVHPGDILGSGRPQSADRALVHTPHRWSLGG